MNKFKWWSLDNLPTIWILAVFGFGLLLAYNQAGM